MSISQTITQIRRQSSLWPAKFFHSKETAILQIFRQNERAEVGLVRGRTGFKRQLQSMAQVFRRDDGIDEPARGSLFGIQLFFVSLAQRQCSKLQLQPLLSATACKSGAPTLHYETRKFAELHLLLIDSNWRFAGVDENPLRCIMLWRFLLSKNE